MVIITGATGTIGRHLVRELHEQGVTFRAVVRDMGKGRELGCDLVLGDFSRPDSLPTAFRGAEALFLNSSASPEIAAQQTAAIAAAKLAGVQRIVKVSALGAQAGSRMALGRWHAEVEQALRVSGLGWTILQPTYFMQNFLDSAASIKAEGAIYGAFGEGRVPFVDAADIAAVGVAALSGAGHESKTYVLTGGEPLTQAEVAEKIGKAIGKPVRYADLPVPDAIAGMIAAGLPDWLANDLGVLMAFFATGGGAAVSPVVEQVTGRKPRSFDEFLAENAAAFRS
jgi:uncharacterized protein YbjT (DUF2867 family)